MERDSWVFGNTRDLQLNLYDAFNMASHLFIKFFDDREFSKDDFINFITFMDCDESSRSSPVDPAMWDMWVEIFDAHYRK